MRSILGSLGLVAPVEVDRVAPPDIARKQPQRSGWRVDLFMADATRWMSPDGFTVISSVEYVSEPAPSWQWHISVSRRGPDGQPRVASDAEVARVLADFDMVGAEEDNHVAHGRVRNFWLPVPPELRGVPCTCKETEEPHQVGTYVWRDVPGAVVEGHYPRTAQEEQRRRAARSPRPPSRKR